MTSIPISNKHGVNPSVVVCARCGKDTGELVLPGKVNRYSCSNCKTKEIFLQHGSDGCPKCGKEAGRLTRMEGDVEMPRKISMGTICPDCVEQKEIVKQGGVYWECKDCKSIGVVRAEAPLAQRVREINKVEPPAPCGIEFTKEDLCPVCGPHAAQYKESLDAQKEKPDAD